MNVAKKLADALSVLTDRVQNHMEIDAESAAAGVSTDDEAAIAQAREALAAYDESQRLELPELPTAEFFDGLQGVETYSETQMREYARAARACAPQPEGLLIVGDVLNGFSFVGPFACESDAVAYASVEGFRGDWTTCTMRAPETDA